MTDHQLRESLFLPEFFQQFAAKLFPFEIHPRRRFIQHQNLRLLHQRLRQQNPLQFAAGQRTQTAVDHFPALHGLQIIPHLRAEFSRHSEKYRTPHQSGRQIFQHGQRHVPVEIQFLRHIAETRLLPGESPVRRTEFNVPFIRQFAQNGTGQCRFSGTVRSHDRRADAARHRRRDPLKDLHTPDPDIQIPYPDRGMFRTVAQMYVMTHFDSAFRSFSRFPDITRI